MLRLASIQDECVIVTNLFRDDPPFAYFITDRLFLFNMIPIMDDRELQNVLNRIEDSTLSAALVRQKAELVNKIMKNISRRRADRVRQELHMKPKNFNGNPARIEIHRLLRLFFEERFGRELKIPADSRVLYKEKIIRDYFLEGTADDLRVHSGEFALFSGKDIYIMHPHSAPPRGEGCIPFHMEKALTQIFRISGVTESTLFLTSNFGIRYAFIHIYDWISSYEDSDKVENIGKSTVVPLRIASSSTVLTIGAVDATGRPCEQVIRVKTEGS
jgi:hypothetical protein